MEKIKGKFSYFFNKLKNFKVGRFLNNYNNNYFKYGIGCLIVYFLLGFLVDPKPVNFDHLYNKLKEGGEVSTLQLFEYSNSSKVYVFKLNGNRSIFKMYLDDVTDQTKKLEDLKVKLSKEEMTFLEKKKFYYFVDLLLYLGVSFLALAFASWLKNATGSKQQVLREKSNVRFKDVAGIDNILGDVKEVVDHFFNSEKVKAYGGKTLSGIILHGSPGTGKTLIAKAIAGETNSNFIAVTGSSFVNMYVGVGADNVRKLFDEARKNAPCVIFIDEIDAFALKRGSERSHSEYDQTVNEMLAQMDGFQNNSGVLVIAATNSLDKLDDALTRPGRFDRKIRVDKPSFEGRKQILSLYISKSPKMSPNLDLDLLAKSTVMFAGADLKNLVDEAIYLAIKSNSETVLMEHFMKAKDKIQMGAERDLILSDKDKKLTAYHEIGHAVLSYLANPTSVAQVSIIPRGNALGVTQMVEDEKTSYSREDLYNRLLILMGGKCAEWVFCGNHQSTGASDDLRRATDIARRMVCEFGMGELGPVNLSFGTQEYSLLSEQTKFMIDSEVIKLLKRCEEETTQILKSKSSIVEALTNRLIEKETIHAQDFAEQMSSLKEQA